MKCKEEKKKTGNHSLEFWMFSPRTLLPAWCGKYCSWAPGQNMCYPLKGDFPTSPTVTHHSGFYVMSTECCHCMALHCIG